MSGNPNFAIRVALGDHVHGVTILWLSSLGLKSLKFGPLYSTKYLHRPQGFEPSVLRSACP